MPPAWLTIISWVAITGAAVSAGSITYDIHGRKHRQQMGVMEAVWPITALYFGPLAIWGYRRFGLPNSRTPLAWCSNRRPDFASIRDEVLYRAKPLC